MTANKLRKTKIPRIHKSPRQKPSRSLRSIQLSNAHQKIRSCVRTFKMKFLPKFTHLYIQQYNTYKPKNRGGKTFFIYIFIKILELKFRERIQQSSVKDN